MPTLRTLTRRDVRRLAITRQHLSNQPKPDLLSLIRDLGCIQLDPIRAVERTHWLVLWSRLGVFDRNELEVLRWEERSLFEYWAHAASLVLTEDYPVHAWKMAKYHVDSTEKRRIDRWLEDIPNRELLKAHIVAVLGREKSVLSREIEDDSRGNKSDHVWWSGRYAPKILDAMWSAGEAAVVGRDGIQRRWGLAKDFMPAWTPRESWTETQITRFSAQRAIRALGVGTAKHINYHYTRGRYPGLKKLLPQMVSEGIFEEVAVKDVPGTWYLHHEDVPLLEAIQAGAFKPRTTLLSPFDNLICDRDRTFDLWDFFFRIEIYVPKAKREFGYYVLPILDGDKLIGRVDPSMDRKTNILTFHNIYAQPKAPQSQAVVKRIRRAMNSLGKFLGAKEIVVENVPAGWEGLA